MPIVELWVRFGRTGGSERWEKIQFAVLESAKYKLIIGMDVILPRKGVISGKEPCSLVLEREGLSYSLPLKTKAYVMRSSSMQGFLGSMPRQQAAVVDLDEVCQLEMCCNQVGPDTMAYAGASLGDLALWTVLAEQANAADPPSSTPTQQEN